MLRRHTSLHLALATLFVLPGLAGQEDGAQGLRAQLDATIASIDLVGEIARRLEGRDPDALAMLLEATTPARLPELQREARLISLRNDVSRLRLAMDKLLVQEGGDGRAGSLDAPRPRGDAYTRPAVNWTGGGGAPTLGLDPGQPGALASVLPPLEHVDANARRRGNDAVALEESDYSADAVRQGKLMFRAGRHAEAVQLLTPRRDDQEASYWLAQALRALDRAPEASEILRKLAEDANAGPFARYAKSDLEFIEFERALKSRKSGGNK